MRTVIIIDGLVGVGKSTLFDHLQENLPATWNWKYVSEPINFFTYEHYNLLKLLKEDPKHNAALVQLQLIEIVAKYYTEQIQSSEEDQVILCDRYIYSCFAFIDALYAKRYINIYAWHVLTSKVNTAIKDLEERVSFKKLEILLEGDVKTCLTNIQKRNREAERGFIDEDYLICLKRSFRGLYNGAKILSHSETLDTLLKTVYNMAMKHRLALPVLPEEPTIIENKLQELFTKTDNGKYHTFLVPIKLENSLVYVPTKLQLCPDLKYHEMESPKNDSGEEKKKKPNRKRKLSTSTNNQPGPSS